MNDEAMNKKLLTKPEIARRLGIPAPKVKSMANYYDIKSKGRRGHWVTYDVADFERVLREKGKGDDMISNFASGKGGTGGGRILDLGDAKRERRAQFFPRGDGGDKQGWNYKAERDAMVK